MQVIFFAYSNSESSPLPSLKDEDDAIFRALHRRALQQHYFLYRDAYSTRQKIVEYLTTYRDKLFLFHFSGHAERDHLLLGDESARAEGIAHILGQCAKLNSLKLVVLNGCSTYGQVQQLLDLGIPVVIATHARVGDHDAANFSTRFYQALAELATIEEAFELAIAEVLIRQGVPVYRGLDVDETPPPEEPLWGIFYKRENAHILREKLPAKVASGQTEDFIPNELLFQALTEAVSTHSEELQLLQGLEFAGKKIRPAQKNLAIINSLPAPIAKQIQKLKALVDVEDAGYDKVSMIRLEQLARTYQTTMDLLVFIMLSQLWETCIVKSQFYPPPALSREVLRYLNLSKEERHTFDYLDFLYRLRLLMPADEVIYFVNELEDIGQWATQDDKFRQACQFFHVLQQKLNKRDIAPHEIAELCIHAEERLADCFLQLGFLAKYTLAAIDNIGVERYRYNTKPAFIHAVVMLSYVSGGLTKEDIGMEQLLYNRSVVLLKLENDEIVDHLNLSPFIIDAIAFDKDKKETDSANKVPNIHFFQHYEIVTNTYFFEFVNNPKDEPLNISAGKYDVLKKQFDAFKKLLLDAEPI